MSISSIVYVKSDQFNCYLDLIAPRQSEQAGGSSLCLYGCMQAWELISARLWRNLQLQAPAQTGGSEKLDDINNEHCVVMILT